MQSDNVRTTVWKLTEHGHALMAEYEGLPFGVPEPGAMISIDGIGNARRSGVRLVGAHPRQTIQEVRFTVVLDQREYRSALTGDNRLKKTKLPATQES